MEVDTGATLSIISEKTYNRLWPTRSLAPLVFADELGKVQGTTAKFCLRSDVTPKYFHARPVPYTLRVKVEWELDSLQADGVMEPIQFSDWATPIVPVINKEGSVRI